MEVKDRGGFRLVTAKSVFFQGEELVVRAETAALLKSNEKVRLQLTARQAGNSQPLATGEGELHFPLPAGPDGEITVILEVLDAAGKRWGEAQQTIPVRGNVRAEEEQKLGVLEKRLQALSFASGTGPAKEIDYSRLKVTHLRTLIAAQTNESKPFRDAQFAELAYTLEQLEKGQKPLWGLRNKTYRSSLDDSEQGYVVAVPPVYGANDIVKYPVFIFMHGFINDAPWRPEGKFHPVQLAGMHQGVITVAPYGRGSSGYRFSGEKDVWDVLAEIRRDYRVDEDRIYLGGFSMGGNGTFLMGSGRPDQFAAIVPCSSWVKKEWVKNLLHVPAWMFCGGQESCAPLLQKAHDFMKGQGTEVHFDTDPASGHTTDFIDFEEVTSWLLTHHLVRSPKHIHFETAQPSHSKAYWATMESLVDYGLPARMDVVVKGQTVEVTMENVAVLHLRPPAEVLDLTQPVTVLLNGKPQTQVRVQDGALRLSGSKENENLNLALKNANAPSGPIVEVFADRFLFVYGTGANAKMNRTEAETLAKNWNAWHHAQVPVKADREVTTKLLQSSHLVCVGAPAPGSLVAKSLAALPLKISGENVQLADQTYTGKNLGVCLLGINPQAPGRYVLWLTGSGSEGVSLASQYLLRPKQSVCRVWEDFAVVERNQPNEPKLVSAGWFDANWKSVTLKKEEPEETEW
jgi:dienelactone hydrolase